MLCVNEYYQFYFAVGINHHLCLFLPFVVLVTLSLEMICRHRYVCSFIVSFIHIIQDTWSNTDGKNEIHWLRKLNLSLLIMTFSCQKLLVKFFLDESLEWELSILPRFYFPPCMFFTLVMQYLTFLLNS